tara:strand:+ start:180 stop:1565 length:1386 start_codon:yes stop_codon:yes gene_type:complete
MATIRRAGFGSVFEVENEKVGIGTSANQTNTVQVLGETKASNALVVGLSTLTTYQGFVDSNAEFGNSNVDINSQSGTMGNIEICHGDFNVSSASTLTSSVNQLTLTDSFSVPTGNTDSRIHCHTAGSMRFNEDLGTLEFYTGDEWRTVNSFKDTGNRGRGIFAGGRTGFPSVDNTTTIESIQISTLGDSIDFGEMTNTRRNHGNCSSSTRGLMIAGSYSGSESNNIEYITIASSGNGIDFGDATETDQGESALASSTRGVHATGNPSNKVMDYVEIATLGNAIDFGDRVISLDEHGAVSSATRGLFCGGGAPSGSAPSSTIQLITIASKGNATTFGDLTNTRGQLGGGVSDGIRGVVAGGHGSPLIKKGIDFVTIASEGNATHFGDLQVARAEQAGAASNRIRGVFAGGTNPNASGTYLKSMESIIIATSGNATFFGDLSIPRERIGGGQISDSHGGLGGF